LFVREQGELTAEWRAVRGIGELRKAADELGYPLRLKAPIGGYDGRSQVRIATSHEIAGALARLAGPPRPAGTPLLVEREIDFAAELSVITARALEGNIAPFPLSRNRHDAGILVESAAPAPVDPAVAAAAQALGARIAEALDAVGLVTAELFLLRDGSLAVNELAPRVHNSGHWTIEGARTSQFEQHVRAICGLPLGDPAAHGPTAMVNLLGAGEPREARLEGAAAALVDPLVHLHVYDKRRVFERRKMGHLTAAGAADVDEGLARARAAVAGLRWA
jgi:5-(carboxyamino)imidazole ribonucleotide synthase